MTQQVNTKYEATTANEQKFIGCATLLVFLNRFTCDS